MISLLKYAIPALGYAYFFSRVLPYQKAWKAFALFLCVFLFGILPVSYFLAENYTSKFVLQWILLYLFLGLCYKRATRTEKILAIIYYQALCLLTDLANVMLFLATDFEVKTTSILYHYPLWFYILNTCFFVVFSTIALFFIKKSSHFKNSQILTLASIQVIHITYLFLFMLDMETIEYTLLMALIFLAYGVILFFFLHSVARTYQEEKQRLALSLMEKEWEDQIQEYAKLRTNDAYRKLRHDFINLREQNL